MNKIKQAFSWLWLWLIPASVLIAGINNPTQQNHLFWFAFAMLVVETTFSVMWRGLAKSAIDTLERRNNQ